MAFRPGHVTPTGLFAPLVRAAHERWDLGLLRSAAMLAGVLTAALAAVVLSLGRLRRWIALAAAIVVACVLVLPAVALQAGLRRPTAPWFFTNDSTYQIELAGSLIRHGSSPYGHDYRTSGLQRFYSLNGSAPPPSQTRQVALRHFAYFPGSALAAAVWGLLPKPLSDYRFFVALCALALLPAALLFPGPPGLRIAAGLGLAANPLIVQASWFGTADAPSLLLLVLAFGLIARRRTVEGAAFLAAAIVFKQFALVAIPFAAVMIALVRGRLREPVIAFAAVLLVCFLPFLVTHPHALWSDTVTYGTNTYRIIGYGLAALLLRAHVVKSHTGSYPFPSARRAHLASRDGVAGAAAASRARAVAGRRGVRAVGVHAALHRPRVPDVVPALAAGRRPHRLAAQCGRGLTTTVARAAWPFAVAMTAWRPALPALRISSPGFVTPCFPRKVQWTARASLSMKTPTAGPRLRANEGAAKLDEADLHDLRLRRGREVAGEVLREQ